ncbi:MAG: flagellar basal body-associated FliL family protein [Pyrinomonadaceae bacterium]
MSAPSTAEPTAAAAPPKKSKKLLIIIVLTLLVVAGGGGGGYFFFFKSASAATSKETAGKSKKSKAVEKDEEGEEEEDKEEDAEEDEKESKKASGKGEEPEVEGKKGKHAEEEESDEEESEASHKKTSANPDDSKVTRVIELEPFIVNLADKGEAHYLRLTVNVGVGESEEGHESGGEKGKADPLFTTRVRNAMLAVLTTKTSDEILSAEGKSVLRKELLKATRKVSAEPHVYAVYITDCIVQL